MRTGFAVPMGPMSSRDVSAMPETVWLSVGPRNVVPSEPRSASAPVACQRSATFGSRLDPTSPP